MQDNKANGLLNTSTDFHPLASRLLLLLACIAVLLRLAPLLDIPNGVFWLYMTEDGYLMQTVARNMAIGLGMSTAEGTIPTNGVQPLATIAFAAMHALAGGSKLLGIVFVTILSAAVAALTAYLLWRLAGTLLRGQDDARGAAVLVAAAWVASPLVMRHSANGLETGIYYLAIVGTLLYYFSISRDEDPALRLSQRLLLGLLLGLSFLARNDAVFFIAAVLLAHLVCGRESGGGIRRRFADCIVAGLASIAVASPWLIFNQLRFGSIVPISGIAESHDAPLASNLAMIPANLLEATLLYLPIPRHLETDWRVAVAALVLLAALGTLAWRRFGRADLSRRRMALILLIFAACIGGYYGLFFGAAHFVTRYVSALTPLLAVVCIPAVLSLAKQVLPRRGAGLGVLTGVLFAAFLVTNAWRVVNQYRHELNNGHRQVVAWVTANVDERDWVGAVQTGTLGYFHDRTINLDGKVNPDALREVVAKGDIRPYVLSQTRINYVADWIGASNWIKPSEPTPFGQAFEIVVKDRARNLAVLRRIERIPLD